MLEVLIYPKCSTCQKAVKWLKEYGIDFKVRHIVDESLSKEELKDLHLKSGLPLKKFFNTSGIKYRELGLKDKLANLSNEECYELLAGDGMLVKRPLAHNENQITLGFKELEYEKMWRMS